MHFDKLGRGELVACVSGLVLAGSLFLHWYGTDYSDPDSKLNGRASVTLTAWQTQHVLRWVLIVLAVGPLILAWIVLRQHQLSWPRGEVTAVGAVTAIVLVLVAGFVAKPGQPKDTISIQYGWFVALVAGVGMLVGAAQRTAESERRRKPPGMI